MTGGTLIIREATAADARAIAALGSRAFRETHATILEADATEAVIAQTYSVPALTACIAHCAAAPGAFFLLAARGPVIAGYLHYDTAGSQPELHRIYVDLDRKGNGIGTALLDALHARLPAGTSYRVIVAAANAAALRFYRRRGFVEHARIDRAFYPGVALPADSQPAPIVILRRRTGSGG